jgi:hypothetical protein
MNPFNLVNLKTLTTNKSIFNLSGSSYNDYFQTQNKDIIFKFKSNEVKNIIKSMDSKSLFLLKQIINEI